jgi:hypothetical protein
MKFGVCRGELARPPLQGASHACTPAPERTAGRDSSAVWRVAQRGGTTWATNRRWDRVHAAMGFAGHSANIEFKFEQRTKLIWCT